ncbi:hypothetical protein J2847_004122 [Azospirillum agricola]|uniref:DUF2829 domain-containing protein n=1 Tax=Azospirillum agricola TaxID=1720247 RepID=UPI001AEA4752|nr:DUF2829 domain-containing protein [Azospirillum agricola]MBP2230813.1 hypothetical protein [Azospirillum agricola]
MNDLPIYQCHKRVQAAEIRQMDVANGTVRVYWELLPGGPEYMAPTVAVPNGFFARSTPALGDYLVIYDDGYMSHSPKAAFEAGYQLAPPVSPGCGNPCVAPTSGLDFGAAIAALKAGKRVARAGWNGKGMWLALTPGSSIPAEFARSGACKAQVEAEGVKEVAILPHIDMRAADGSIVIGWRASQTDMLADDWLLVG